MPEGKIDVAVIKALDRNLASKKDCRRGNSGNYKELQVLTRIHHVP
ncbi:uncharacterized protein LOC130449859 [Diorhabda sublineata]|nr:uncharacterized protein LOC130449859 [Diorhabda sublineata]